MTNYTIFSFIFKIYPKIFADQQHATSNELNFTALASIEWQGKH